MTSSLEQLESMHPLVAQETRDAPEHAKRFDRASLPPANCGSTMRLLLTELKAFTSFASGNPSGAS
jgi:hypothetical protein